MFRGINAINLDAKGRLAIPARYRERIGHDYTGHLVLTIDTEVTCLLLYPLSEWEIIEARIQALPSFNHATRRIQRLLIGHAQEVDMDSQGRILLPPLLREYAELDKRIMLVGQGRKFEIWNEQQWNQGRERWLAEEASNVDELPDEVKSISL